jgi:ketosteroid isomerase-like protein
MYAWHTIETPAIGEPHGKETPTMATHTESGPTVVVERLAQAINGHDLEQLAGCFDPDYLSEFPAHPDRAFRGHDQMRKNWSQIFGAVPDITVTLLQCIADGETVWAEWAWRGTRPDHSPFAMRGVTIQGVRQDRIAWVRMYMEPVETSGAGSDAAVRRVVR